MVDYHRIRRFQYGWPTIEYGHSNVRNAAAPKNLIGAIFPVCDRQSYLQQYLYANELSGYSVNVQMEKMVFQSKANYSRLNRIVTNFDVILGTFDRRRTRHDIPVAARIQHEFNLNSRGTPWE
jgi:hypothetical protein